MIEFDNEKAQFTSIKVVGIGGDHRHQPLGTFNAGGLQNLIGGSIPLHAHVLQFFQRPELILVLFNDQKGPVMLLENLTDFLADPAKAADDVMIM